MEGRRVLWTYSPITYGLERETSCRIYHAVDLLAEYPGLPAAKIAAGERRLADLGTIALASSQAVRAHLEAQGFTDVLDWPNVGEVTPFACRAENMERRANRVVFGGNITPYKVDLELIEEIARTHPELELVLAGPIDEGGGGRWTAALRLRELGVRFTGRLDLDDLAALFCSASVGIIPYAQNPYTRGVNPQKHLGYQP